MQKTRVLLIITRSNAGGAQSHILEILNGLKNKYELILATGESGFLLEESKILGVNTHLLSCLERKISPSGDYCAYKEIRKLIQDIKPDIIHTHSSKAGILGRLAAKHSGIKNIFTAHGWAFADGTPLSRKIIGVPTEFIAAKWCDRIITVSHADKNLAIKYHIATEDKLTVIHNGIADIYREQKNRPANEVIVITMVARLAPQKNFPSLLEALSQINQKYLLQVVGDGPDQEKLKKYSIELGIENNIDFMGARNDVPSILAGSDIFVLSSEWEGYPISIVEAMRAGLPIIASDVGGVSEAVIDNENGYLIPRNNTALLKETILQLITNESRRKTMGKCSRALYEKNGTTGVMLEGIEKVYNSLLNSE